MARNVKFIAEEAKREERQTSRKQPLGPLGPSVQFLFFDISHDKNIISISSKLQQKRKQISTSGKQPVGVHQSLPLHLNLVICLEKLSNIFILNVNDVNVHQEPVHVVQ